MKTQIRNFMMTTAATVMLSAPVLMAQTNIESAEIPFDFAVGSTSMQAGTYTINTLSNHSILLLRNEDTKATAIIGNGSRGNLKDRAVLAFHCYGNRCFLSEVDVPGTPSYVLNQGKLERETSSKTDTNATLAYVPMERR